MQSYLIVNDLSRNQKSLNDKYDARDLNVLIKWPGYKQKCFFPKKIKFDSFCELPYKNRTILTGDHII